MVYVPVAMLKLLRLTAGSQLVLAAIHTLVPPTTVPALPEAPDMATRLIRSSAMTMMMTTRRMVSALESALQLLLNFM